jgi:hypothetical protein
MNDSPALLFCSLRRRTNELRANIKSATNAFSAMLCRKVKSKRRLLSSNFLESLPSRP